MGASPGWAPPGLPVPLGSLIGREREVGEVRELLARGRLVTLTGPGGVGKTRLALDAAAGLAHAYEGFVWFVDLAPLADPALVPGSVARALGARVGGRPALDALRADLADRRVLLVLDNCEHLADACAAFVQGLLRACPGTTVLATSREPLRAPGEVSWPVAPLAVPPAGSRTAGDVSTAPAVRLFAERAAAAAPGFVLADANAAAVARICRRLDGVPLALELAAVRVRVLPPEQIADRLDDRFSLLSAGERTAPPRHRGLRASLDWSYGLLTEPERAVLRPLAVFAGTFTLEAAEAVCRGEHVGAADVVALLADLVDKSLVVAEPRDASGRFRLLETVRQYARDRLLEGGDEAAARARHRAWYLHLAEGAEPAVLAAEGAAWLDRLEADHDNLRAALESSLADPVGAEAGFRLVGALSMFWRVRGHMAEGLRWAEALLALRAGSPAARAKALTAAGFLAHQADDHARADAHLRRALVRYRRLGDRRGTAYALHVLGRVAYTRGAGDRAVALLEESLALSRRVGDRRTTADALYELGRAALHRGDHAEAEECLQESLALFREERTALRVVSTLAFLGAALAGRGELGRARAFLEQSLALARAHGFPRGVGQALHGLGRVALLEGDTAGAAAWMRESLADRGERYDREGVAECLEGLALGARRPAPGNHGAAPRPKLAALVRAARLLGAAAAIRATIGAPLPPADRPAHEARLRELRLALGDDGFESAWTAGRALALDQAVVEALDPVGGPGLPTPPAGPPPLSAREGEVAALILDGMTTRGIAAALSISERTVERHVGAMMHKLGVASRAQIAAWLAERRARGGTPVPV